LIIRVDEPGVKIISSDVEGVDLILLALLQEIFNQKPSLEV
jgi:hypothetical protein